MKSLAIVLLLCSVAQTSFSQTSKVQTSLSSYFQLLRQGKSPTTPSSILAAENAEAIIDYAPRFLNDSSLSVRLRCIAILKEAALKSSNGAVRKKATRQLALQWGQKIDINRKVFQALKKFHNSDFDEVTKDSLVNFVRRPWALKSELLRLIGFVGSPEDASTLLTFSTDDNSVSVRWSAWLAMARLGDQQAIDLIVAKIRKRTPNDEVVEQLFPDLIYTRQKAVIDYLVEVIQSDQANCASADNDNPTAICCGYRVMEQLAPVIENYPLSVDISGDVKTWDYRKSLAQVRQWLNNNSNYTIETSTF